MVDVRHKEQNLPCPGKDQLGEEKHKKSSDWRVHEKGGHIVKKLTEIGGGFSSLGTSYLLSEGTSRKKGPILGTIVGLRKKKENPERGSHSVPRHVNELSKGQRKESHTQASDEPMLSGVRKILKVSYRGRRSASTRRKSG